MAYYECTGSILKDILEFQMVSNNISNPTSIKDANFIFIVGGWCPINRIDPLKSQSDYQGSGIVFLSTKNKLGIETYYIPNAYVGGYTGSAITINWDNKTMYDSVTYSDSWRSKYVII